MSNRKIAQCCSISRPTVGEYLNRVSYAGLIWPLPAEPWDEYRAQHPKGYQYSWFRERYQQWAGTMDRVIRQDHRAGEKLFGDFAGHIVPIVIRLKRSVMDDSAQQRCSLDRRFNTAHQDDGKIATKASGARRR